MNLVGDVTVGTVVSGATLLSLAGFIWRTAAWKTKQDEVRKADVAARLLADAANDKAHAAIIATLGNGAPGTVVRVPTCERLHAVIEREIGVVRDDIREVREIVQAKK